MSDTFQTCIDSTEIQTCCETCCLQLFIGDESTLCRKGCAGLCTSGGCEPGILLRTGLPYSTPEENLCCVFDPNEEFLFLIKELGGNGACSRIPLYEQTFSPTKFPTPKPTDFPTLSPIISSTSSPTGYPTLFPTTSPTSFPTLFPTTLFPTEFPTSSPTLFPTTLFPTEFPTSSPTLFPTTLFPTEFPTSSPTSSPTRAPSPFPSFYPTSFPTEYPTLYPTIGISNSELQEQERITSREKDILFLYSLFVLLLLIIFSYFQPRTE
eukprot:snap_masked-scaffold_45-processed-gene-1.80-mRNA-1 protein AED:0.55 eAED:0.55 QI:0/-1/0/1/-1/1/1/0/265